jgi:hypothetical protein
MPENVFLDEEFGKIIRKITKSNETTGTGYIFIISKKGIREADNEIINKKGIKIKEKDYTITIGIEKTSNITTELLLITFKDFIIIDFGKLEYTKEHMPEDKIIRTENFFLNNNTGEIINATFDIILLKNLSDKEEFRFSIKGHKIKITIEKSIHKRLGKILLNQPKS